MPDRSVGFDNNTTEFQASDGAYYLFAIAADEYAEIEVDHPFKSLNIEASIIKH